MDSSIPSQDSDQPDVEPKDVGASAETGPDVTFEVQSDAIAIESESEQQNPEVIQQAQLIESETAAHITKEDMDTSCLPDTNAIITGSPLTDHSSEGVDIADTAITDDVDNISAVNNATLDAEASKIDLEIEDNINAAFALTQEVSKVEESVRIDEDIKATEEFGCHEVVDLEEQKVGIANVLENHAVLDSQAHNEASNPSLSEEILVSVEESRPDESMEIAKVAESSTVEELAPTGCDQMIPAHDLLNTEFDQPNIVRENPVQVEPVPNNMTESVEFRQSQTGIQLQHEQEHPLSIETQESPKKIEVIENNPYTSANEVSVPFQQIIAENQDTSESPYEDDGTAPSGARGEEFVRQTPVIETENVSNLVGNESEEKKEQDVNYLKEETKVEVLTEILPSQEASESACLEIEVKSGDTSKPRDLQLESSPETGALVAGALVCQSEESQQTLPSEFETLAQPQAIKSADETIHSLPKELGTEDNENERAPSPPYTRRRSSSFHIAPIELSTAVPKTSRLRDIIKRRISMSFALKAQSEDVDPDVPQITVEEGPSDQTPQDEDRRRSTRQSHVAMKVIKLLQRKSSSMLTANYGSSFAPTEEAAADTVNVNVHQMYLPSNIHFSYRPSIASASVLAPDSRNQLTGRKITEAPSSSSAMLRPSSTANLRNSLSASSTNTRSSVSSLSTNQLRPKSSKSVHSFGNLNAASSKSVEVLHKINSGPQNVLSSLSDGPVSFGLPDIVPPSAIESGPASIPENITKSNKENSGIPYLLKPVKISEVPIIDISKSIPQRPSFIPLLRTRIDRTSVEPEPNEAATTSVIKEEIPVEESTVGEIAFHTQKKTVPTRSSRHHIVEPTQSHESHQLRAADLHQPPAKTIHVNLAGHKVPSRRKTPKMDVQDQKVTVLSKSGFRTDVLRVRTPGNETSAVLSSDNSLPSLTGHGFRHATSLPPLESRPITNNLKSRVKDIQAYIPSLQTSSRQIQADQTLSCYSQPLPITRYVPAAQKKPSERARKLQQLRSQQEERLQAEYLGTGSVSSLWFLRHAEHLIRTPEEQSLLLGGRVQGLMPTFNTARPSHEVYMQLGKVHWQEADANEQGATEQPRYWFDGGLEFPTSDMYGETRRKIDEMLKANRILRFGQTEEVWRQHSEVKSAPPKLHSNHIGNVKSENVGLRAELLEKGRKVSRGGGFVYCKERLCKSSQRSSSPSKSASGNGLFVDTVAF